MSGVSWTPQEEDFLKESYHDLGPKVCASALGRSYGSTRVRATRILDLSSYRHPSCNELFFKSWTRSNSYCFGLLTSDGTVVKNGKNVYEASLGMTDCDVVETFARCAGSKVKVSRDKRGFKDVFRVRLRGAKTIEFLHQKSLHPRKSCKEVWPSIPTKQNTWNFCRGVFDGDGCITRHEKGLQVRFFAGKFFLEHLKYFFESEGIKIASILKEKGLQYRLSIYRKDSLRLLYEKMYKNSKDLRMSRKYNLFKSYFGELLDEREVK